MPYMQSNTGISLNTYGGLEVFHTSVYLWLGGGRRVRSPLRQNSNPGAECVKEFKFCSERTCMASETVFVRAVF